MNDILESKTPISIDKQKASFLEASVKKLKSQNNNISPYLSSNQLDSLVKDDTKTFTLPSKYLKDAPFKAKSIVSKKADTTKGVINFNNIRHEMGRKDKVIVRNNSKNHLERNNSKSPVLNRDNSIKSKLSPLVTHKAVTANMESITPNDVSELSCNREVNNILPVKKPIPEDRKFSILDILASESIYFII